MMAARLLERIVPHHCREVLVGDLVEEYAQRLKFQRRRAAAHWFWGQVLRSAPPLLWSAALRESWHVNASVAGTLFFAVGIAESRLAGAIAVVASIDTQNLALISLFVGLAIVMGAGYVAARIRPAAATAYAAITVLGVAALVVTSPNPQAFWSHLVFLITCPLAALAGRNLAVRLGRPAA